MPPRKKDLPDASLSAAFAERMAVEQRERNWSDAGLAKRASKYFPMTASTIWKIKNAKPRRRLDLDEADAIAQAFGYTHVRDFIQDTHMRDLVAILADLSSPLDQLGQAAAEINHLMARLEAIPSGTWSEVPEDSRRGFARFTLDTIAEAKTAQTVVAEALQRILARVPSEPSHQEGARK